MWELEIAVQAARSACQIARTCRERVARGALPKPDGSLVTIADYAAQAIACRILADAFPNDPIIAEESAEALRAKGNEQALAATAALLQDAKRNAAPSETADWIDLGARRAGGERFWTLDPIDGTRGYVEGGHYCAAVALVVSGEVQVAVLGCPTVASEDGGALYCAVRGQGAWQAPMDRPEDQVALSVSDVADLRAARLCQRRRADRSHPVIVAIRQQLGMTGPTIAIDSQVKYACIARGDAEVYLRPRKHPAHRDKIWDHAAGVLLVEEAGGRVTDVAGRPLDFRHGQELTANDGVLVSNGLVHECIVAGAASSRTEG